MGSEQSNETLMCIEPRDDGVYYYAKFDARPFAAGAVRHAYRGTLMCNSDKRSTARYHGSNVVIKVFKKEFVKDYGIWNADISTSKKANELATEFNSNKFVDRILYFPIPSVAKMDKKAAYQYFGLFSEEYDMATNPVGSTEYVAIEDYIPGNYKKFNSNNGYVNDDVNSSTMAAFSHWTFHQTYGSILVCDLQGVFDGRNYRLTDPAIHSKEGKYGNTDLGELGQKAFFHTHQCNSICRGWRKLSITPQIAKKVSKLPMTRHTMFTHQVPFDI